MALNILSCYSPFNVHLVLNSIVGLATADELFDFGLKGLKQFQSIVPYLFTIKSLLLYWSFLSSKICILYIWYGIFVMYTLCIVATCLVNLIAVWVFGILQIFSQDIYIYIYLNTHKYIDKTLWTSEYAPQVMAHSWLWDSQIANKKY